MDGERIADCTADGDRVRRAARLNSPCARLFDYNSSCNRAVHLIGGFVKSFVAGAVVLCLSSFAFSAEPLDYKIELTSPTKLFTSELSWAQPRIGTIPPHAPGNATDTPIVVMTMQH